LKTLQVVAKTLQVYVAKTFRIQEVLWFAYRFVLNLSGFENLTGLG